MTSESEFSGEKAGAELARRFIEPLEKAGATDPAIIGLEPGAFADAIVVVSATSARQARGVADAAARFCRENGITALGVEGYDNGDWILVDCGDIIINVFQEDARDLYKLEELWSRSERLRKKEARV